MTRRESPMNGMSADPQARAAEVLAAHQMMPCGQSSARMVAFWAACEGCDWTGSVSFNRDHTEPEHRAHVAAALAEAGLLATNEQVMHGHLAYENRLLHEAFEAARAELAEAKRARDASERAHAAAARRAERAEKRVEVECRLRDEYKARAEQGEAALADAERRGAVAALRDFVQWVATNRAFNGSKHQNGQALYNDCLNAELPTWAEDFITERLTESGAS